MRKLTAFFIFLVASFAIAATGLAASDGAKFPSSLFDKWFLEARPIGQGIWVTDKKGCLYRIQHDAEYPYIVGMNDDGGKPLCRN